METVTDAAEPLGDLVTHAHDTHVVVIGGGIAGLVAALECAKVGMPVTVVEASPSLGGIVTAAEVAGLRLDVGASCWSTKGRAVRALVDELGLGDRVVTPRTDRTWIAGLPDGAAAPVPSQSVLGIPANPWDDEVRRIIGGRGVWRAYLDRLRPPLTIGKERDLDKLVRTRMGDAVVDRILAPLTAGGFGMRPDEVDVIAAAPGLNTALTRTGSLGGAVADVLVGRDEGRPVVEGLSGGMPQLVSAVRDRLELLGAQIVTDAPVAALARTDDGRWRVALAAGTAEADDLVADMVFVATGQAEAHRLLGPLVGGALDDTLLGRTVDAAPTREIVTLVVDAPALDDEPRGAAVYAVPGTRRASGLVHQTARWEWLRAEAGAGRHVLSVAFDGPAGAHPTTGQGDAALFALAREEASALLGVPLEQTQVRGAHRQAYELARPASALGHSAATTVARAGIGARQGLAAVGAWLSGSGLARVVADAQDEAERVRRAALWGAPGAG